MNRDAKMTEMEFIDLGQKGYRETWELQKRLLEDVKERKLKGERFPGYVVFVEHTPVYTLGKSGNEANMLIDAVQLRDRGAEFIKVDRGGDITFHGPGQLVVYPIIDLDFFGCGIREYVGRLEEIVIRTLAGYGIEAGRLTGATGVWIEPAALRVRKICAIGVKCSRFVTMHGFALNVNTDLEYFGAIHPCGFVDKGVTSMQKEVGHAVDMQELKEKIRTCFCSVFKTD